ncbi:ERF family protein [Stenotrophomonas sp.]|uniref:ERF family protein n=1 Tax=Stenotrophomonas sp. TaxID=69392 RepID=UPI0028A88D6B|nr:ERF family protein [Stenotrophomonas sp.]
MNQIVTIESSEGQQATGLAAVLQQALMMPEQGVDRLERMWEMHKEMQDRDAARAYADAMKACQKEMPAIQKRGKNKQTNSRYALLEDINRLITPIYTRHGFSLSFGTDRSELADHVGIVCDVMHDGGYSKTYTYDAPIDNVGIKGEKNKTTTHGRGSAISYGRRYLVMMIFNLTIGDDDDGNAAGENEHQRIAREVAQEWVQVADGLQSYEDYTKRKAEVLQAYGGKPTNLPPEVREAFNRAAAATKPKD